MKKLLVCLEEELEGASIEKKVDVGLTFCHFQDEEAQNSLTNCFRDVPVQAIQARAFAHLYGQVEGEEAEFVTSLVRLSLADNALEATDAQVKMQIGERAKHITDQLIKNASTLSAKKKFLDSPNILRDISITFLLVTSLL